MTDAEKDFTAARQLLHDAALVSSGRRSWTGLVAAAGAYKGAYEALPTLEDIVGEGMCEQPSALASKVAELQADTEKDTSLMRAELGQLELRMRELEETLDSVREVLLP